MAASVEARVPFLDHEVVEFVATLHPSLKLRGFREKAVLRDAVKGLLPESTRVRPKQPFFTPIREWFFNESNLDFVEDNLSKDALLKAGLFDPDLVAQYRRQLLLAPDHLLVRHQLEWTLVLVLGTQILHRQFIQEKCLHGPQT
jgi:asparagine synthase (glutamine-hydrolysing)